MSKSVIIMDTPDSCDMCDMVEMVNGKMYCEVKGCGQCTEDYITCRPNWCPLKLIPQKDTNCYFPDEYSDGYRDGYNACIDEILK